MRSTRLALCAVVFAALFFTWFFALQSIYLHWRFESRTFDLATYEQAFWSTIHGHFLRTTYLEGDTRLSHHFSFAILLPIGVYAIWPRTETILVFQAATIAAAALPLFALALSRLRDPATAALLALAYLVLPATELPVLYDYHDVSMLPLALLTLLWALDTGRTRVATLALLLAVSCKEEGALLAAGALVFMIVDGRISRRGYWLVAALVAYFAVVKALVMPWLAGGRVVHSYYYDDFLTPRFFSPAKLVHFVRLFAPLLFLPLLTPASFIMLATPLAIVFLATRWALFDFTFQYNFYLLPFLFAGTAVTLSRRWPPRTRFGIAALILVLASIQNAYYGPLFRRDDVRIRFDHTMRYDFTDRDRDRYERIIDVLERIPPEVSVTASETLGPHLARRETTYRGGDSPPDVDVCAMWPRDRLELPAGRYEPAFQSPDLVVWTKRELGAKRWFEGVPVAARDLAIASLRQDRGRLGLDTSVGGKPLTVAGTTYERGYGTHAASEIRLRLFHPARTLRGEIGIDDDAEAPGKAVFVVKRENGAELFRSADVESGNPAQPFHADVGGLSEVVLLVEAAADGNVDNAHADWLDLRLEP